MKDIFIIHHSVLHDAFRSDYSTMYKQSSRDFLKLLLNHYLENKTKLGFIAGAVFNKLVNSSIGDSKVIWVLPEQFMDIDYKTYTDPDLEKSTILLAAKKGIRFKPHLVATKPKENIELYNTSFPILTPKEAIDAYNSDSFLK